MFSSVASATQFLRATLLSHHGVAFLFGVAAYYTYVSFISPAITFGPRAPKVGDEEQEDDEEPRPTPIDAVRRRTEQPVSCRILRTSVGLVIAVAVAVAAMAVQRAGENVLEPEAVCVEEPLPPVHRAASPEAKAPPRIQNRRNRLGKFISGALTDLKPAAGKDAEFEPLDLGDEDSPAPQTTQTTSQAASEEPVQKDAAVWHHWMEDAEHSCGVEPATSPDAQLMQLRCYAAAAVRVTGDKASEILTAAKKLRQMLNNTTESPPDLPVQFLKVAQGVVKSRCAESQEELATLRTKTAGLQFAIAALRRFSLIQEPLKDMLLATDAAHAVLKPLASVGNVDAGEDLEELVSMQGAIGMCLLQSLQQARLLAQMLPRASQHVQKALRCHKDMLVPLESLSIGMAKKAKDSDTLFALGAYWSELAVSEVNAPFLTPIVGESSWVKGAGGHHVPAGLARAEALLLRGEELSLGSLQSDRAATRALRLYHHAKYLALKHHDAAAEFRYRQSADVAVSTRRKRLAAHSLTRLAYFLLLRGRRQESLSLVESALEYHQDPLALYLQVDLMRQFGHLITVDQVKGAENTLRTVAGQLPSKTLEAEREKALVEFAWWRAVAETGIGACRTAWDAAQLTLCFIVGVAFRVLQ